MSVGFSAMPTKTQDLHKVSCVCWNDGLGMFFFSVITCDENCIMVDNTINSCKECFGVRLTLSESVQYLCCV